MNGGKKLPNLIHASEYMKDHIWTEKKDWLSQLHNSSSCEIKAWKNIQAWMGFEPMTSAIPVQCSTNWANKQSGSWSLCEFVMYPLNMKDASEYMKDYVFELRRKIWMRVVSSIAVFGMSLNATVMIPVLGFRSISAALSIKERGLPSRTVIKLSV